MPLILGVKVDTITREQAIIRVERLLKDGGQHILTTPNPEFIVAAQNDAEFRNILNRASLALPDGFGLMLAAKFLRLPFKERIAGSDFVWDIARLAVAGGYSVYLLGAGEGVAAAAAAKLKIKNVKLKIVGAESGVLLTPSPLPAPYRTCSGAGMGEGGGEGVIKRIRDVAPDILLVAFGHPKQEKWIASHLAELPSVKIAMGVGGALDFIAGRVRRAPRLLRALGLEWLWRLFLQPWRIVRIYRAVVLFPALIARSYLTKR
ncbi:WecB/TagA/CpsF family glycosyltransferase [Candidatus Uhrbacteria bacterium]|nr:WecB/TagA/CpsF family glycosyltransferase [Candidatus Uhrbacteria bacterium]